MALDVTFKETLYKRADIAAAVVAGLVLSVKMCEGNTEKLDGAIAAFTYTAGVFCVPWAYIVDAARGQLGDGLAGLLDQVRQVEG